MRPAYVASRLWRTLCVSTAYTQKRGRIHCVTITSKEGDFLETARRSVPPGSRRTAAQYFHVPWAVRNTALPLLPWQGRHRPHAVGPHGTYRRVLLSAEGRYFASVEQLEQHDPNSSRAVWVLLDLFPQVEYHAAAEFPATLLCFAGGQALEIVCVPIGRDVLIDQVLQQREKSDTQVIVLVDDVAQISSLTAACISAFCTVDADGHVSYYQKAGKA